MSKELSKDLIMRNYVKIDKFPEYLLQVISNIFWYILYLISFIIPRKKDIWVFGSWKGKRFSENSKYLFLYVANHKSDIKPVWISKDKNIINELRANNYCAYHAYELKGIYYNLRAKYIFSDSYFNSVNFWCCGGATKIQLWHGANFKKIEYDAKNLPWQKPFYRFLYYFVAPWTLAKNDYVITQSEIDTDILKSAFRIKKEKIVVTGCPRNDIIFNKITDFDLMDKSIYTTIADIKYNDQNIKLLLYVPTFRDSAKNYTGLENFDLDKLNKFLDDINGIFIIKFHPNIKIDHSKYNQWNRIMFLPSSLDLYPILNQIDILITDYSSIYIDFLLIDRPIIFFPYDMKDYIMKDRDLYFDYDEFTPGTKAFTFVELIYWIKESINNKDNFIDFRKKIKEINHKYNDGNSSTRIYDFIKNLR